MSDSFTPWSDSNLTERDELLQKVQQLERENAALRCDVYVCPPSSENSYEGLKWSDAFDVIEGDNAKLHNEVTALKHENAALREDNVKLKKVIRDQGDEIRALHIFSDAAIDVFNAARKEGQP